jgi:hypothetical protein
MVTLDCAWAAHIAPEQRSIVSEGVKSLVECIKILRCCAENISGGSVLQVACPAKSDKQASSWFMKWAWSLLVYKRVHQAGDRVKQSGAQSWKSDDLPGCPALNFIADSRP